MGDKPCNGNSNWKQYAVHAPDVPVRKIMEFEKYKKELVVDPPVQEMPVQSLITKPSAGDILAFAKSDRTTIKISGIAWGGGGSAVNRVDVSVDGGDTFTRANLLPRPVEQRRKSEWAWQFFEQDVEVPDSVRAKLNQGEEAELVLTSKALNGAWNVQPASPHGHVNPHGCCVNHWYKVPVKLSPSSTVDRRGEDGDFGNKPSGGKFKSPFRNHEQPEVHRR